MGTIVDDAIYAIRPDHKWILDAIVANVVFGNIEDIPFRFCGREITHDEEFNVRVTCRQTTLTINDITIVPARLNTPEEPVSKDELQQYMSIVGSLSPADLSYSVSQLQQLINNRNVPLVR